MPYLTVVIIIGLYIINCVKILKEYERGVVFRLGRLLDKPKGPGLVLIFYPIDRLVRISLRTITLDVPPQDVITKDGVSIKVNAVVYFRVLDPNRAVVEVEDYHFATSQMAQTSLRSVLGQVELDGVLTEREQLNSDLQKIIDTATDPWGIKVSTVELKHVDLPQEMQRAMARQAEAERERRAKVIAAEGEHQAAERLALAAETLQKHPSSLQLRYLQTMLEIAGEGHTTTFFPVPVDLLTKFLSPSE